MNYLIIALVLLFVIILVIIMFLFLKKVIFKFNNQTKDLFIDKLQIYDNLINEKENELNEINNRIKKNKEIDKNKILNISNNQQTYVYDSKNIDYQEDNLFQKMKYVDLNFDISDNKILKDFINKHYKEEDQSKYQDYITCKKILSDYKYYNLVSLDKNKQLNKVKELLKDYIYIITDFNKKYKEFDINKFKIYLENKINLYDPHIYVYSGNKNVDYSSINSYIISKYDKKVYRGIYIIYKGKIYDYCLK